MASQLRSKACSTERALRIIQKLPRIYPEHVQNNPGYRTTPRQVTKVHNNCGRTHKELERAGKPPLGWIFGDWYQPWQRRFKSERHFNADTHLRREYPPLSLLELQRMIDLGWLNVQEPIDLASLCNTTLFSCNPKHQHFGVQLTDEGADVFAARVNIEVQWASELAIAAVERNGGVITTAYYDPVSLDAVINPSTFFEKGEPIPKRLYPPADVIQYYIDPKQRGYLSDPIQVEECRKELSQKFGYELPNISSDANTVALLQTRKHPLQCFYGLESGWIVNIRDKLILKPSVKEYAAYYQSFS